MARNHIALPLGGMIVLCAILLLAPDAHGQAVTARKKMCTLSGTVGLAGVTMNGFPVSPPPITDDNGVYSVQVEWGWSGTITPVKKGYTFAPRTKTYPKVTDHMSDENYTAALVTYTISGSVGQPGVSLIGFPEEVVSDASGRYTATVPFEWSGTVTPTKRAYQFEPPSKSYNQVARDMKEEVYKASDQMIVISGTVGADGVTMKGLPGNPVSGPQGTYRADVKFEWSGTVTPTKEGHEFTPPEMPYAALTENQTNQDYTARVFTYQISGTAGLSGVVIKGLLGGDIMTDDNGLYTATVTHGWAGKITPEKPGYTFTPRFLDVPQVTASKENQDFAGKIIYYTISGNAGAPGVTMSGLPGDPVSDAKGSYSTQVEYNWFGSVNPKKEGFVFTPPAKEYPGVTQNQTQDYKAQGITFKITGNVGGLPQVVLKLVPSAGPASVVTGPDGSYSIEVPYGWKGTMTPQKAGFSFEPSTREFPEVLYPQTQDYVARIMQHSLAGRIVDETGSGVAGVLVQGEGEAGSTTTDATGQFDLQVNHGWKGKLTFTRDGYTFNPPARILESVVTDIKNMAVAAKLKMLTITDRVTVDGVEPLAEVKITAIPADFPGAQSVQTDNSGKYSIRIPYGWTGELKFEKPGFDFDPPTKPFTNLVEDIDNVNPKPAIPATPPAPPVTQAQPPVTQPQPPVTQPQPPVTQPQPPVTQPQPPVAQPQPTLGDLEPKQPGDTVPQRPDQGAIVPSIVDQGPDLHYVLRELARSAGVKIEWDGTVKADPVPIPLSRLAGMPITSALQTVLLSLKTPYAYDEVGERAYKVYRPLSNSFFDMELVEALRDLSASAEVPIIADPNVTGRVNIDFQEVSLDDALEMLLAGKPFVFKKTPRYYLVAERSMFGPAFMDICETRRVRLNYTAAQRAKLMLSPIYAPYVQAEVGNPMDPNDQGNTLIVTAAPGIIDKIVDDIKQIDRYKRQVLLDARVVVMERGDLLNLGVEWGWPKIQAGTFTNRLGVSDGAGGTVVSGAWPWAVQIGYTPDRIFTDSLMMTLNLLKENSQADIIANPKVIAQDGKQAEMRVVQEEWFMMQGSGNNAYMYSAAQLQKIESGTVLTITPYIGDNNDITLQMAVEVSDSIPKARGSDLPLVTRRAAKNSVTIKDGGTVAVAGLTENRSKSSEKRVPGLSDLPLIGKLFENKNNDKASREVAVFVTAHLVPESTSVASRFAEPVQTSVREEPSDGDFADRLREALANQPQ